MIILNLLSNYNKLNIDVEITSPLNLKLIALLVFQKYVKKLINRERNEYSKASKN